MITLSGFHWGKKVIITAWTTDADDATEFLPVETDGVDPLLVSIDGSIEDFLDLQQIRNCNLID